MTFEEELLAIDSIFSGFASGIAQVHENEKYNGSADEWIRLSTQNADGTQRSLGDDPIYRYRGVCFVQIFTKPDTGAGRSTEITDLVTDLLRSKTLSGITFRVPRMVKVGEKGGWYQVNVLTDFYRED